MKRLQFFALSFFALLLTADWAMAQVPGLDPSPADISYLRFEGKKGDPVVKVVYGRPQKKGRTMLGGTEKYGEVWRTGANEATEIKLYRDVTFGDKTVKAGTYALFTVPGKTEWVIIFNSALDQWGAYSYDKSKDVARVTVKAGTTDKEVEAFTIYFEDPKGNATNMVLTWENTEVKVPVKF